MATEGPEPEALSRFLAAGHQHDYDVNDVIISAGDHSTELYYLLKGSVSVQYEDMDGHEIILAYLHEGDFFGEIGLFDERHERSAWVRARTESTVVHLPQDTLQKMLEASPDLMYALLGQMATREIGRAHV